MPLGLVICLHDASVGVAWLMYRNFPIVSVGMPHGKRGIVLRISTSVENFDLNELQRNFRFALQVISARLVSTSDIHPVPIAEKHMY